MKSFFSKTEPPLIKVTGRNYGYPVRRIFCVGRNYVEHVLELGNEVEKNSRFILLNHYFHYWIRKKTLPTRP